MYSSHMQSSETLTTGNDIAQNQSEPKTVEKIVILHVTWN